MSSQERFDASKNGRSPRKGLAHQDCPQCKRQMIVKQLSPIMRSADLDEVVYGCADCGTEIKRTEARG